MKKISRLLIASCLLLGISGCATEGTSAIADTTPASASTKLIKGKTTQAEVRQIYGGPVKTSFTDSGNEIWEYEYSRDGNSPLYMLPGVGGMLASSAEVNKKSLVIFFNKQKIVQQYAMNETKVGGSTQR